MIPYSTFRPGWWGYYQPRRRVVSGAGESITVLVPLCPSSRTALAAAASLLLVPALARSARAAHAGAGTSMDVTTSQANSPAVVHAASSLPTPAPPIAPSSARALPCTPALAVGTTACSSLSVAYSPAAVLDALAVPAGSYAASQARAWASGAADPTCTPSRVPGVASAIAAATLLDAPVATAASRATALPVTALLTPTPSPATSPRVAWPSSHGFSVLTVRTPGRVEAWVASAIMDVVVTPAGSMAPSRAVVWAAGAADPTIIPARAPAQAAALPPAGFLSVGVPMARQSASALAGSAILGPAATTAPTRQEAHPAGAASLDVPAIVVGGQRVAYAAAAREVLVVPAPFLGRTAVAYAAGDITVVFTGSGPLLATISDLERLSASFSELDRLLASFDTEDEF